MSPKADLVLVPVDFSPGSESAARYAFWLAGRLGARLRLLHVFAGLGHASAGVAPDLRDELLAAGRQAREQAGRDLTDLAARLVQTAGSAPAPKPETAVVDSRASTADAIVEAAREAQADLIVMGTHGRSGLRRMVLGSVAEQVVRSAGCPVLTLR